MATTGLHAAEYSLDKVFSDDFNFTIPDYQRPYRWGVEQAVQLLQDLEESLNRGADDEYFLGSLVLIERGSTTYDVVDGQQRLTTLTMLFAVLRDLAEDDKEARELGDLVYEPGSRIRNIPPKARLAVRRDLADFFRIYVQEPDKIAELVAASNAIADLEPKLAVRDNAKALYARLSVWPVEARQALATFLLTKTFLVVVRTPSLSSAHRIFSVMNSRGLDLSPADIFKSMVIGELPEHSPLAESWEDKEEDLGADDFTELFRDMRTVETAQRARYELLQEFPEQVLNRFLKNGRAAEFVEKMLVPYADAFLRTVHADFPDDVEWQPVNRWLKRFARIDNKDWRPTAIWALYNHSDDAAFLSGFFAKLERLAASFLVRGTYTTPRIQRYLELLTELKAGKGFDAPSFQLSREEIMETRRAIDGDIYGMQKRRARYVLLRLDELLTTDGAVEYSEPLIQIEHVLPQTPTAEYWLDRFDEAERDEWTNRLGNLLLLNGRKNNEVKNFSFDVKKSKYFKGSAIFQLTSQVIEEPDWNLDVVEQRQQKLTGTLYDAWALHSHMAAVGESA